MRIKWLHIKGLKQSLAYSKFYTVLFIIIFFKNTYKEKRYIKHNGTTAYREQNGDAMKRNKYKQTRGLHKSVANLPWIQKYN